MIRDFVTQPYPLFAIVVVAGRMEPHIGRVVGWQRTGVGDALAPVLTLGARTFVPGVADHVAYADTREEAERRAAVFATTVPAADDDLRDDLPRQRLPAADREA